MVFRVIRKKIAWSEGMHSSPKISPPCPKNQALKIGGHRYHPWPMSQPRKKWLLQVGRIPPATVEFGHLQKAEGLWPVKSSALGFGYEKKKMSHPRSWRTVWFTPEIFISLYPGFLGGFRTWSFHHHDFQVPAVELWGCIDSHYPQVEVPFLFLVRELIILQNNV